jgi:hypothetical protein
MSLQAAGTSAGQQAAEQLMQVRGLTMSYGSGAVENKILQDLDLDVAAG